MSAAQPLIDYLNQLQEQGEEYIQVDQEAKSILRQFFINARQAKKTHSGSTPVTPPQQTFTSSPATSTPHAAQQVTSQDFQPLAPVAQARQQTQPAQTVSTLRKKMVFSTGDTDADLMIIAPAPAYHDETNTTPLAGPAGQKMSGILKAMGLSSQDVYITNLVKFRPEQTNQTTNTRQPSREETSLFLELLLEEINIIQPKVIITLGEVSSQTLLKTDENLSQLRGKSHPLGSSFVITTDHPSYLLLNEDTQTKRKLWEDMLTVMNLLKLPISQKQQNYFT